MYRYPKFVRNSPVSECLLLYVIKLHFYTRFLPHLINFCDVLAEIRANLLKPDLKMIPDVSYLHSLVRVLAI